MEKPLQVLSPLERAARYRELAAAALKRAVETGSAFVKANELDMAARWDSMAQDTERRLDYVLNARQTMGDHMVPDRPAQPDRRARSHRARETTAPS